MGSTLIEELFTGDSKLIKDLLNNEAAVVGFLTLIRQVDDIPEMETRFYEDSRSLYQATASGVSVDYLAKQLAQFFGKPVKPNGKSLPVSLRFESAVKHLGGIRKDQILFLKKLKIGSLYGALWPWQRDAGKIEVHLGISAPKMSGEDRQTLETLVNKSINQQKIESVSDVGGQIHGISLPSFLQMSEMEGATYTLKVTSGDRIGRLYLDNGSLIAAQFEDLTGNEAAYRIISWDKAAIQIEAADPEREREIHDPLMHVMMESLKIKDEAGAGAAPPAPGDTVMLAPSETEAEVEPEGVVKREPRPKATPDAKPKAKPKPKAKAKAKAEPKAKAKPKAQAEATADTPLEYLDLQIPTPIAIESEAGPFQKPTDRSIGKQDQLSRTAKLLIVLGVVIAIALVSTFGTQIYARYNQNRRYDQLIDKLNATDQPTGRVDLLSKYLDAYPRDRHRGELQLRLNEAKTEIEKHAYDATVLKVSRLPLDKNYEASALKLYTTFLTKYPESAYAPQINDAMSGIRELLGTAYFEDLKKVQDEDFMARYQAYQQYLEQFPEGGKRQAVLQMIDGLAESYARSIESKAQDCDIELNWGRCIDQCERYLNTFGNHAPAKRIKALATLMRDKRDLADLSDQVVRVGDDFAAARKLYQDYLAANPETTQKIVINDRIAIFTEQLEKKKVWERTEAYARTSSHDIVSRIKRLDAYIEQNPAAGYTGLAKSLRAELQPALDQAIRQQREAEARRQRLAKEKAARLRAQKERQRIAGLQASISEKLQRVGGRYRSNGDGSVTDTVTGLVWSVLDSTQELGGCINYDRARAYVSQLKTGGYTDWRLPTAGELATIYKNKPFFPQTGTAWYWTSESFAKGYHRVVDVVSTVPETVFTRESKSENSCGAVRAVRR